MLRCEQTAMDILLTQQAQWYVNIAERQSPLCRLAMDEILDVESLADTTGTHCQAALRGFRSGLTPDVLSIRLAQSSTPSN